MNGNTLPLASPISGALSRARGILRWFNCRAYYSNFVAWRFAANAALLLFLVFLALTAYTNTESLNRYKLAYFSLGSLFLLITPLLVLKYAYRVFIDSIECFIGMRNGFKVISFMVFAIILLNVYQNHGSYYAGLEYAAHSVDYSRFNPIQSTSFAPPLRGSVAMLEPILAMCKDGTPEGSCSDQRPYYCSNRTLENRSGKCGCPANYEPRGNSCKAIKRCVDGTKEGECSKNNPWMCQDSRLIIKEPFCGYSPEQYVENSSYSESRSEPEELTALIHARINSERQKSGLDPLDLDENLSAISKQHSQEMGANDYFEHEDLRGRSPSQRAIAYGYGCYKDHGTYYTLGIGENLFQAWMYSKIYYLDGVEVERDMYNLSQIADSIVLGWMNSTAHRDNILSPEYQNEGIGVAITTEGKVYVTEDFC